MEHILQFVIGIDEDRIQEEIKRSEVNKNRKVLVRSPKFGEKVLNKLEDKNND